jgi:hypothetical protein
MPLYDVLKTLDLGRTPNGRRMIGKPGDVVELEVQRGTWLEEQYQAVEPHKERTAENVPALVKPRPKAQGCCGR